MKKKECKVFFNTLIKRTWKKENEAPKDLPLYAIEDIIKFAIKLGKKARFFDLKDNKFCFIEAASIEVMDEQNTIITGYFKSARNEFRPDLINKKTGTERKNPKELSEGDIEKTHFIIRINKTEKEVFLFHEHNFHGINTQNIVNYFTYFNNKYLEAKKISRSYSIKHLIIPRNNFLTELDKLSRTRIAEIYFDKKLLGSGALNFSNRRVSLKKELKLVASAQPKESITEVAIDFYNVLNQAQSEVTKVRIFGTDEYNNEVILDTNFMSKIEFLEIDINENTGELNSTQLFTGLKRIAKNF